MKHRPALSLCLAAFCFVAGNLSLSASGAKIAVIDMQKVFSGYEKTRTIELKLNQQLEVYKEYAAGLMKEYKTLRAEFEKLRDDSQNVSLSESERENLRRRAMEKAEQLKLKETELSKYNQTRRDRLKENFDKRRAEVLNEIKKVVQNKCALQGIQLVLDKSGITLNDLPLVIYASPVLDITGSVLNDLNRGYRENAKLPASGKSAEVLHK